MSHVYRKSYTHLYEMRMVRPVDYGRAMSPTCADNSTHSSNIHLCLYCVPQHTLWSQHSAVSCEPQPEVKRS